jgi:hypothetical protein
MLPTDGYLAGGTSVLTQTHQSVGLKQSILPQPASFLTICAAPGPAWFIAGRQDCVCVSARLDIEPNYLEVDHT